MAEFSTTVWTRALNQFSTPRVTSTPKNSATITAGATAAMANMVMKRRCSRAPASLDWALNSATTRPSITVASASTIARPVSSRVSTSGLAGPRGPLRVGDDPSITAEAVSRSAST